MNQNTAWVHAAQLTIVLMCAFGLKLYYSSASVNELRWILAPTAFFVELATGVSFTFESYAGYMSSDHSFLIASSCSGVNFLITAFLMLSLSEIWRYWPQTIRWRYLAAAAIIAYLATIAANTIRISTALQMRNIDPELVWLNPEQIHRFEGIFIYFGCLLLLFIVSERMSSPKVSSSRNAPGLLRKLLLPLAIYYGTTLGIPLANQAYRQGAAFWEHAVFVLLTPVILIVPLAVLNTLRHRQTTLNP
jgi:exosortase K